ncbi:uncharacterized protein PO1_contig_020_12 [Mycobacterium sp. PO1]|nr:uncharacterized protein PO1_contig_020_12 [Mycobacterium sp. PO1]
MNDIEAKAGREPGAVAVVVLSDFLLTDRNPAAVLSRLRSIGDSVHAVVLGAYPPAALLDDPNVTVTRLTPSSAPGAAARAVFSGLISFRTHSTTDQGSAARHHQTDDEEGELIT